MTISSISTALVVYRPTGPTSSRSPLAGFLAGYRGLTRDAYGLDLRQYLGFCRPGSWVSSRPLGLQRGHRTLTVVARGARSSP